MLALYSVNIVILGQANMSLLGETTIFTQTSDMFSQVSNNTIVMVVGLVIVAVIIAILYWFFGTEIGCCIRATGNNEHMVRALAGNTDNMKIIGLMLSNGLVALSGALVSQQQGYGDVNMGIETIVIGLASVIIGEVIFGKNHSFWFSLAAIVGGSVIYRIIIAVVLQLGLPTNFLKLLTAGIVALALSIPVIKQGIKEMKKRKLMDEE